MKYEKSPNYTIILNINDHLKVFKDNKILRNYCNKYLDVIIICFHGKDVITKGVYWDLERAALGAWH